MNSLLNNAVIFSAVMGLGYSLFRGDELFAFSFFVNAITCLSLYSAQSQLSCSQCKCKQDSLGQDEGGEK
jgi:hypothetical protein